MAKSLKPKTKKNQPPARQARHVRMVEAKLKGRTNVQIAAAEHLTAEWVARELGSDESKQIIAGLVKTDLDRIARLYDQVLVAIELAFKADKMAVAGKERMNLGPDHYARLAAAKRYLEVISLGRPTAKPPETGKDEHLTLQDLRDYAEGRPVRGVGVQ